MRYLRPVLPLLCLFFLGSLCLLAGCGKGPGSDPETSPDESGAPEARTYRDIGSGKFSLDRDTYYSSVGQSFRIVGRFDFDEPDDVPLTVTADDPGAVEAQPDGTVTVRKAGDFTLTVREEKYGSEAVCALRAIGGLRDNILIDVFVDEEQHITPAHFADLKSAGVDVVTSWVTDLYSPEEAERLNRLILDEALATWSGGRGLRVEIYPIHTDEIRRVMAEGDTERFGRAVAPYGGHPALFSYMIIDEPRDPNPWANFQNALYPEYPDLYTTINFFPGFVYRSMREYEHRMSDYLQVLDDRVATSLCFDNYPFTSRGNVNEAQLFGNFEAMRRAGLRNGVPTCFYLQGTGLKGGYCRPDRGQLTYHLASALAYGVKSVRYYSWFTRYREEFTDAVINRDGSKSELYDVAAELHDRVHTIGPILVRCEAEEVYHAGNRGRKEACTPVPDGFFIQPEGRTRAILSLFRNPETGREYLMIVNKNFTRPAVLSFTLTGADILFEIDSRSGERREIALPDGQLSLRLEAGDFAFFELPEGDFRTARERPETANLAARAARIGATASLGAKGWFIDCVADGRRVSDDREDRGWKLPDGTREASLTFTFDGTVSFNRLDLYPAGEKSAFGQRFPTGVRIETAPAGEPDQWTTVYSADGIPRPTTEVPVIRLDAPAEAGAVRLTVWGEGASELAEVEIYLDGGDVPLPGPTSYEASSGDDGPVREAERVAAADYAEGNPLDVASGRLARKHGSPAFEDGALVCGLKRGAYQGYSYELAAEDFRRLEGALSLECLAFIEPAQPGSCSYLLGCENSAGFGIFLYEGGETCFEVMVDGQYEDVRTHLELGRWHHLAGVYDGQALRFYVDGACVGTRACEGPVTFPDAPANRLYTGADVSDAGTPEAPGDVRIRYFNLYAGALTEEQIRKSCAAAGIP